MAIKDHFHTKYRNDPTPGADDLARDDGVPPLPKSEPPHPRAVVAPHDDKQSVGTC